jgi:hypothetical protein
MNDLEYGWEN